MAQFTWRDVAAPNFNNAAAGFNDAARLLKDSISTAVGGVEGFDKSQRSKVSDQLAMFIAQNPDVDALEAAVRAGQVGGISAADPRGQAAILEMLSPDKLNAMREAQRAESKAATTFNQNRAQDALAPQRFAYQTAIRAGKLDEAAKIAAGLDVSALGWDKVGAITDDIEATESTDVSNDSARTNYTNAQIDRSREEQAIKLVESIKSGGDPQSYEFLLNSTEGVDPLVSAKARAALGLGGGAGTSGGGGGGPAPVALAATGGGLPSYRSAIASIESAGSGGYAAVGKPRKSGGDVAYGRYQVMGANIPSWTKEALGRSMTPQEFLASPEAQDTVFDHRFGSYIDKYGSPEEAASVWFTGQPIAKGASLKDVLGTSGSEYVAKFKKALGSSPAELAIRDAAVNQDVKSTYQLNNANTIALEFDQAYNDPRNENDLALQLLNVDGFKGKGMDVGAITGKIVEIQARAQKAGYPINPAVAAVILKNSGQEESWLERNLPGESLGSGRKVNWKGVDSLIGQLADGTMKRAATSNEVLASTEASYALAGQQRAAAQQRLIQLQQAARNNPKQDPRLLARAEDDFVQANAVYEAAQAARAAGLPSEVTSTNPLNARPSVPLAVNRPVGNPGAARKDILRSMLNR